MNKEEFQTYYWKAVGVSEYLKENKEDIEIALIELEDANKIESIEEIESGSSQLIYSVKQ